MVCVACVHEVELLNELLACCKSYSRIGSEGEISPRNCVDVESSVVEVIGKTAVVLTTSYDRRGVLNVCLTGGEVGACVVLALAIVAEGKGA